MKPSAANRLVRFQAQLYRIPGKGGWTFVTVPSELAPPVMAAWGMTPVIATVDGRQWQTTVWKDKEGKSYLPVPKKIRKSKEEGAMVDVALQADMTRVQSG
jgi:hypothetical protein